MPLRTISQFKNKLSGGGARSNLFEVRLEFPSGASLPSGKNDYANFLVKGASLPASNIGPVEVPFRGRILKLAGDRTFDTWTVTVINDVDFELRNAFEQWMNIINKHDDSSGATDPADYMKNAYVDQLDRDGSVLRTYKFWDIFPTNISPIDLSYESTDTIQEFTVEFQVQWWEAEKGDSPNSGGDDVV